MLNVNDYFQVAMRSGKMHSECGGPGQARASFAMTMMAACYNLKRLTYFQKAGIVAF